MANIKNPIAFPAHPNTTSENMAGMTLRDYFAAKAMQAITSNVVTSQGAGQSWEYIAEGAYLIADAMLKTRSDETV